MKRLVFFSLSTIAFMTSSCEKEKDLDSAEGQTAYEKVSGFFGMDERKDFFVLTSSSSGASLFSEFDAERTSTAIQAASMDESMEGSLDVNNIDVPFMEKTYWLQTDTTLLATEFVGKVNSYEFTSSGDMVPDFAVEKYGPAQTDLNYSGLQDKRLPRGADLTVTWTPDHNLPSHGKAGFVLFTEDENADGQVVSDIYEVNDEDGQYTIDESMLSQFTQDRVTVMYVRGYHDVEEIEGVEVDFQFVGHTWTTLLFEE